MGKQAVKTCPKCGAPMAIRLGELVCKDCGYFMAVDAPEVKPGSHPKPKSAPIFNAGRRGIARYDNSHIQASRFHIEKWVVVCLHFLSVTLGFYLLNPVFQQESMHIYTFKQLFFAGLVSASFLALALFIDWRGFKLLVLIFVCLTILLNLWPIYTVSQLKTQLILYKLLADEFLLVWLANILFRETARTR